MVINTAGWVKGPGLSVLVDLIASVQPTHVVCISSGVARKDLPDGAFWDENALPHARRVDLASLHACNAVIGVEPSPWPTLSAVSASPVATPAVPVRSASDLRSARLHAWLRTLHAAQPGVTVNDLASHRSLYHESWSESAAALLACAPLALDLADVAVVSMFRELQPSAHAAALNGAIVSLVHIPSLDSAAHTASSGEVQVCSLLHAPVVTHIAALVIASAYTPACTRHAIQSLYDDRAATVVPVLCERTVST